MTKKTTAISMPKWLYKAIHFLKNMVAPDNVTWPSLGDSFKNMIAVICVSIVCAALLILMDTMFAFLLRIPYLF